MIKKILIALVVLVVVVVVVVATRPSEFKVTRSGTIGAAPAAVFPHVNDLRKWEAWSPWAKLDPNAKNTFEGPSAGTGAILRWVGNNQVGEGSMTITESRPNEWVQFRLEFLKPFESVSTAEFNFKPEGDQTVVTWSMSGKNNFIGKAIGLFIDCDKMVGGQFEQGFANMKSVVEAEQKELTMTRVFDAPRELVWKAWTEPEQVKRWWGPKNFIAPVCNIDLRVDGAYLYCMRSPEGQDYWSTGVYREIAPPERIVCTDSFADDKGNRVLASHYGLEGDWPLELQVTVTFEESAGKTIFNLRHAGVPAGEMRDLCAAGWSESLDKLGELLAQLQNP